MSTLPATFKALLVSESAADKKVFQREIVERRLDSLPANDVLVRVQYSSLNYKDALSATGNERKITPISTARRRIS